MKILWGSPLPPTRSGVSDYAVELLGELGHRAEVRVLEPPGGIGEGFAVGQEHLEIVPGDTTPENDEIPLIHLGNNPHHAWLVSRLPDPGTVVVLHDLVLHHLLVEMADGDTLETVLRAAHGEAGAALARARRSGITGPRDPFFYPARGAFLGGVKGAIVHSSWGRGIVEREFPGLPVAQVGLAVEDPGPTDKAAERERLGILAEDVVLMHLGFLTPEKGLEHIVTGLAAARSSGVRARLVLVGEGRGLGEVQAAAESVGCGDFVSSTGWVEAERFPSVPAAADLGAVLRTPSAGETSAAVVRFLATGTPVAVSGLHQFLEWPEMAAPRVTPGVSAPAELARLLAHASAGGEDWAARRHAARLAYEAGHRPAEAARRMIEFLETL
jgi:glycosyltransferase involved in cell wall biosynthesis